MEKLPLHRLTAAKKSSMKRYKMNGVQNVQKYAREFQQTRLLDKNGFKIVSAKGRSPPYNFPYTPTIFLMTLNDRL